MEELYRESGVAELKAVALPWDRVSHAVRHGAASAFITSASRERLGFSEAIGPTIYELGQNPVVRSEASLDQGSIFQVDGLLLSDVGGRLEHRFLRGAGNSIFCSAGFKSLPQPYPP